MHARGERRAPADLLANGEHPRSTACTRARRPRSSSNCATFLGELRALAGRRRAADARPTTRSSSRRSRPRPDFALLQTVLLRSLQQARYRPDNVGHFGLAYEAYAHFTSPIRRYPDLLVHRAINAVLAEERYQPSGLELGGARRALLDDRAPRRRCDARRRELAQVLVHAVTRSARTSTARSAASRASASSSRWTASTSTASCT